MKRILSAVMCAALLLTSVCAADTNTYADDEVEGLHEKLSALFMENYFTEEEFEEINNKYLQDFSEYLLNEHLPARQQLGKMETGSMEEEYALEMEKAKTLLDYSNGMRISLLLTNKYTKQYSETENFSYLFSGDEFWGVPDFNRESGSILATFDLQGNHISITEEFDVSYYGIIIPKEAIDLMREETPIRDMLLEKGETKVEDIKLCTVTSSSGLYIKCPDNEYFLKFYDYNWDDYKKLEDNYYEFLTITELAENIEQIGHAQNIYYTTPEKPVYEAEAEALQAAGLLKGNENGLDLLKPLTRIEAAAMLLRAIGESETAESTVQVFADVPAAHWGFGAAAQAYTLGLIKGVGDNLFAPDKTVTAAEFSTMALRAANTGEFDWTQAVDIMIEKGILTQEQADKMDLFTRGDMAKIIYEARQNGLF